MTNLWFSRIRLRREAHIKAIAELLLPCDDKRKVLAARHRLIWSLFSDGPDRKRDFLWREDRHGLFYILSARRPVSDMFEIETKEWAPALAVGSQLAFSLRANPVISRKTGGQGRGQRHDVIMDCLSAYKENRKEQRNQCIQQAGESWLAAQGQRYGFTPEAVNCDSYHQHILPRKNGKSAGKISTLDFEGHLTISDPQKFLAKLATGFGSAKAFGCGLMMIRRA